MKLNKLKEFERGWIYGAFEPSLRFSRDTEVGILDFPAGYAPPDHMHKMASEFNLILSGLVQVNGVVLGSDDIFSFDAGERIRIFFVKDTRLLCIKSPSLKGDKYEV